MVPGYCIELSPEKQYGKYVLFQLKTPMRMASIVIYLAITIIIIIIVIIIILSPCRDSVMTRSMPSPDPVPAPTWPWTDPRRFIVDALHVASRDPPIVRLRMMRVSASWNTRPIEVRAGFPTCPIDHHIV